MELPDERRRHDPAGSGPVLFNNQVHGNRSESVSLIGLRIDSVKQDRHVAVGLKAS